MEIRKATMADVQRQLELFDMARSVMRNTGNMEQWTNGYPSQEVKEEEIEVETPTTAEVPEEFANRMAALEASVIELTATLEAMTAQFNRATPKPGVPPVNMPKKETKLSKEAVAEAAKRFYNK
jgi:hypothetical protein